jgi:hypothetical protein
MQNVLIYNLYSTHRFVQITFWQLGALDELNDPNWAVKVGAPLNKVGQFVPKVYRFQTAPVFGAYDGLVSSTVQHSVCNVMFVFRCSLVDT